MVVCQAFVYKVVGVESVNCGIWEVFSQSVGDCFCVGTFKDDICIVTGWINAWDGVVVVTGMTVEFVGVMMVGECNVIMWTDGLLAVGRIENNVCRVAAIKIYQGLFAVLECGFDLSEQCRIEQGVSAEFGVVFYVDYQGVGRFFRGNSWCLYVDNCFILGLCEIYI